MKKVEHLDVFWLIARQKTLKLYQSGSEKVQLQTQLDGKTNKKDSEPRGMKSNVQFSLETHGSDRGHVDTTSC